MDFDFFDGALWGSSGKNIMDISKDKYTNDKELFDKMLEIIGQDNNIVIRSDLFDEDSKKKYQISILYLNSFEWYTMYFIFEKTDTLYKIKYQRTSGDPRPCHHFVKNIKNVLEGEIHCIPSRDLDTSLGVIPMLPNTFVDELDEKHLDAAMASLIWMTSIDNDIESYTDTLCCQLSLFNNSVQLRKKYLNKILENIKKREFDTDCIFSIRALYVSVYYIKELFIRNMITRDDITEEKIQEKIRQLLEQNEQTIVPINAKILATSLLTENI
jgi:hypothetical protein